MSSSANMEHPNGQPPKIKNGPFVNQQDTPVEGGKCGLTVGLPVIMPN